MARFRRTIGIFGTEERYGVYERVLAARGIVSATPDGRPLHQPDFAARPHFQQVLASWDSAGVDIVVVDDASFPDKSAMVSGIGRFMSLPRAQAGHLRIIFVADPRRLSDDEIFARLASFGVTDTLLAGRDGSVADTLAQLIRNAPRAGSPAKSGKTANAANPANPANVTAPANPAASASGSATPATPATPAARAANTPASSAASSASVSPPGRAALPPRSDGPVSPGESADFAARGKSIIAVAGIMPRAGATNCSIVLARTLAMLGRKPALIVDSRTGTGFRKGYRSAAFADGKSFRVNGVDIFPDAAPASLPRRYSHVVVDVGYPGWGLAHAAPDADARLREFARADLQVVYVPCVSPADFEYLNRFFESQTAADLERYAIGVWGATDELFDMLRAKFREKAPDVFMWNVDVYRWPLSLGELSADIVEVLRPVLPRGVYAHAMRELAAGSARGADGGTGDVPVAKAAGAASAAKAADAAKGSGIDAAAMMGGGRDA